MLLSDRAALVTGGASGIGRAIAERCATEGAAVAVADVDAEGGRGTAAAIREAGGTAAFHELDVRDAAAFERIADTVADEHGGLDALFNNAGITQPRWSLGETPLDERDRLIDVNIKGVWNGCRAAVPVMEASGGGAIVNTASVGGYVGFPKAATYSMTKAAVLNFTKALAAEVGHAGIRVNAICPSTVDTPMAARVFDDFDDPEAAREATAGMAALGRLGRPKEVAAAAVFLASDEASFVTGHGLAVDGGFLASVHPPEDG